ncbi:NAD(P)/FAD-dependent oxidoreductase [Clostridium sp. 'White wine YQ']|uniref:NAD(P)/FAD-dependent oxidoreductase n=1 Tax=Clostridium sp. 'White wine YQ' TaxID=3027474 RepID=UPI002366827A|nr:FAD-dependent oxidoreductase [Clostridium sp. 'White wine YQ']MDD7793912.1 FAD-dependent oxidoreductase [Clostridium sp. 'White wine YQ']
MKEKIVIVGCGAASVSAIKSIRSIDSDSEIHVYSEEAYFPYYRPKISKKILDNLNEEEILIQKKDWYKNNNVDLHLNSKVTKLSPESEEIILSNEGTVSYSKLLLATGADNIIPNIRGIHKLGVFTLRSLNNAYKIIDYIKRSDTILLIGGGIQNLEMATSLSNFGKKVTVSELAPRLMPRQLDIFASEKLRRTLESNGVKVMLSSEIDEILGEDKVKGYVTKSGIKANCDMVIYSIGISPNTEIVKNTNLKINKGILVNERMQTSFDNIYAAGDICEFNNRIYGLWDISTRQGKVAGLNICNENTIFQPPLPVTSLETFNMSIYSIGDVEEKSDSLLLVETDASKNRYYKVLLQNNHIIGAIIIGDLKTFLTIKKLIENSTEVKLSEFNNISVHEFIDKIKS